MADKTALSLELVLKFLDCAQRTVDQEAKDVVSLDDKQSLYYVEKRLHEARHILRANYYAFCDWCETDEYVRPTKH